MNEIICQKILKKNDCFIPELMIFWNKILKKILLDEPIFRIFFHEKLFFFI